MANAHRSECRAWRIFRPWEPRSLGSSERSLEWLERSGQNLRHKAVALKRSESWLWFVGAGDLWEDEIGIDKAFEKTPEGDCKILLAHNADTADIPHDTRIDLILCGHTHGGQVNIPYLGTPILPVHNPRSSRGFIQLEKMSMFISAGIGWAVAPVRLNCFPEISCASFTRCELNF